MNQIRHINNGACPKCRQIIETYPGFNHYLANWFYALQAKHPEIHCSEAGRGRMVQEILFRKKASKAHYGESAHNFNCALDLFENSGKPTDIYEVSYFVDFVRPALTPLLNWYGEPGSEFFELPHVELRDWREQVKAGNLKLVEAA